MTVAAVAALLSLSSCSLFNKEIKTDSNDLPAASSVGNQPASSSGSTGDETQMKAPKKDRKKPGRKDRTEPGASAQQSVTVADIASDLAGEWVIVKVGDRSIVRDENMPYINFVPAENRFYGSNGCNVLNGNYSVKGHEISFSGVLTTMQYCPDVDFDGAINGIVQDGKTVSALIKKIGNETYLYFNDHAGKALMTLVRHNMQFLDGKWMIVSVNGKTIDDEEANVFFDINSLKIHGNTGCNYFNGSILIDPAVANSISFSGMGVTRMMCPNIDQERMILVALEETATAVAGSGDTAILLNSEKKPLITLRKAPDNPVPQN